MVTLISSYYDNDGHSITPTTDFPSYSGTTNLVSQLVQMVLKSRIGSDYYCVQAHHSTTPHCYLMLTRPTLPSTTFDWQLTIGITYKQTTVERWIIQWTPTSNEKIIHHHHHHYKTFLQSVDAQTQLLPLHSLLGDKAQLGFIITSTMDDLGCCSSLGNIHSLQAPTMTTFIGAVDDQEGQLRLNVVYAEHLDGQAPSHPTTLGRRRLSRLSLSAMTDDDEQRQDQTPLAIPLSTSPLQYTHHGLAYSTTTYQPNKKRRSSLHHGLAGSYEESLLSGRMSTLQPSSPIWFHAHIGVIGRVKPTLPPHRSVIFPAYFYHLGENNGHNLSTAPPPPFVGTLDLTTDQQGMASPGYRIPSKGQLQITIKNPNKFLVKLFLVSYDVSAMPRNTKTFLRQKTYSPSSSALKYAIHLQFCRTDKNRVYLYNQVRVVFVNRSLNSGEQLVLVCEGPKEPVYSPLT
ncbi:hypothetical protein BC941DRAFT_407573 [Chlamydoabsidia padenii]|nr:hypothetical protein BC941DRAFT_407573 [Chlamydoabsidia padenii]